MKVPTFEEKFIEALINKCKTKVKVIELMQNELQIGRSSAYNRLKGKSSFSLKEILKLCQTLTLSLDQFFLPEYSRITFISDAMRKLPGSYDAYLTNVINVFGFLKKYPGLTAVTIGTEIPLFHYANFPNLYHFKLFYWKQTFWDFGSPKEHFSINSREIDDKLHLKTKIIGEEYYSINSTEIWTTDIFTPILQQIIYFVELDCFKDESEALLLIEDVRHLCNLLHGFCDDGIKIFNRNEDHKAQIDIYYNELHDGTDVLLFNSEEDSVSFIKYDGPNFIYSDQNKFGNYSNNWINNIKNKSTSISANNQRQRKIFFKHVNKKIDLAEKRIKHLIKEFTIS